MICLIALVVFGLLGIFSATHRQIAFEAFDCVFRRVTFRKCETGLDTRLKGQIVGKLLKFSIPTGRFVFKHFELISWFFTALMIWSIIATGIAGYNYYEYGNCNGPQEDGFCIFDPLGENSKISQVEASCSVEPVAHKNLTLENVSLAVFPTFNQGAPNKVVFIGCYSCEYTREAYDTIKKLSERDDVEFIFAHFPVKAHSAEIGSISNCVYSQDEARLREFNDEVFDMPLDKINDTEEIYKIVDSIGLNRTIIEDCANSDKIKTLDATQFSEVQKTGIYGTPLVFVNGEPVVGPKPYRVYTRLLK